jgi:hypothetical protein
MMLLQTSPSNALIFFRENQELAGLQNGHIHAKPLAWSRYDPIEILSSTR